MESLEDILDRYDQKIKNSSEIYSIYLFDIKEIRIEYKIYDEHHDKSKSYAILEKMLYLFKDKEFNMLLIDIGERIFIKRLSDSLILMLTGSKELQLGKLFALSKID